jgi:hypothetical protein
MILDQICRDLNGSGSLVEPTLMTLAIVGVVRLLLIPVADALPAVQAHFERWPDDTAPLGVEELRELVALVPRYVAMSRALLCYVDALGGISEN